MHPYFIRIRMYRNQPVKDYTAYFIQIVQIFGWQKFIFDIILLILRQHLRHNLFQGMIDTIINFTSSMYVFFKITNTV